MVRLQSLLQCGCTERTDKINENNILIYRTLYLSEGSTRFKFRDGKKHTFGLSSELNLSLNELENYDFDADVQQFVDQEIIETRTSSLSKRLRKHWAVR